MRTMPHTMVIFFLLALPLGVSADSQPWITGYFLDNSMSLGDIPWSKVTHVIHWAVNPNDFAGGIDGISASNADAFTAAAHNAGVKALLCVRDNNSNMTMFSSVLKNNLHGFADNIAGFVMSHNYDGVDLDWEGSDWGPVDQSNYINLIMAVRTALGSDKVITMSVYWQRSLASVVQRTSGSLDQVNVMCYDMDQWNTDLFYNSATFGSIGDTAHNSCAMSTSNYSAYIPASKIGIGIPFYGRIWSGCADADCTDGLHDPLQVWSGKPTSRSIHYNTLLASPYWSHPRAWDPTRQVNYISIDEPGAANDRFISYTGIEQIKSLVQLMKDRGYGGVMEFVLEYDFFPSSSGDDRHPLAAAVYSAIFGDPQ